MKEIPPTAKKSKNIINRDYESQKLLNEIDKCVSGKVIIIFSSTGIGKSRLTEKVLSSIDDNKITIRVKTLPENQTTNSFQGEFIKTIFEAFQKKFRDRKDENFSKAEYRRYKKLSFDYYVSHSKNRQLKKEIQASVINDTYQGISKGDYRKGILGTFILFVAKRIFKIGEYDQYRFTSCDNIKSLSIANDYIKYVLKQESIILNIDNIQNIDNYSKKYLIDWVNETKCKNNFFLLEYTQTNSNSTEGLLAFRDILKESGVSVEIFPLERMDSKHALQTVLTNNLYILNDKTFEEKAEDYYKELSDGNIRKLEDYAITYKYGNINKTDSDPTLENIFLLSDDGKFIFAIISLHNGVIPKLLLENILEHTINPVILNPSKCITDMICNHELIENTGDEIRIKHASILDVWKMNIKKYNKYQLLAYRRCEEYYNSLLKIRDNIFIDREKCILLLLNLFAENEPNRVFELVDEVETLAISAITPEKAWEYLKLLLDSINTNKHLFIPLYYRIVKFCCDMELYKNAYYCLEKLTEIEDENKTSIFQYYSCSILGFLERYLEAIDYAKQAISISKDELLIFYMKLLLIAFYRSINDSIHYNTIVNEIENNQSYNNYLEYGYFLRLAEIYLPRNRSIEIIEKSVSFFEEHQLMEQAAKSRVSLSYIYAITGHLEEAYRQSIRAEKVLLKNIVNLHIFEVNKAAIYLLMDMYGSEIWDMLDKAELTAKSLFNMLVVINNKIVWCIENEDFVRGELLIQKAVRMLQNEPDKHLHAILFYNLFVISQKKGDTISSDKFYNTAYLLKQHCHTLECRLTGKTATDDNTTFLLSKPWHVCFLSYWNIDYLNDQNLADKNYQNK